MRCSPRLLLLAFVVGCGDGGATPALDAGDEPAADASRHDSGGIERPGDGGAPIDASRSDAGHPTDPRDGGALACAPLEVLTPDWYVAPTGRPGGAGTAADPLDLATALSASGPVRPGDRVELAAGRYVGRFEATVSGAPGAPIVFAAAPGARVTIDGSNGTGEEALRLSGSWLEVHGLEIAQSGTDRARYTNGVVIFGANTRLVNCVIHDTAQGVSFWSSAIDSELYGNIIYNNGFEGPDRGHGHAIYTQNATGTKRIANNIIFFGYGFGIHAYTEGGSIQGYDIVDNVWFRAGASRPGSSSVGTSDGCLVGGQQPVARARLERNESFAPSLGARSLQLGWGSAVMNEDVTLIDNYFVGRVGVYGSWRSGTIHGNTFHSEIIGIHPPTYPDNTYRDAMPTGTRVVVRTNAYDAGRVDLVVYDWDARGSVSIDLDDVLTEGAAYEIFSVYDFWGEPVASGVHDGSPIAVPTGTRPPPQPNGAPGAITGADDPGALFGVFVLRSSCAVRAPVERVRAAVR